MSLRRSVYTHGITPTEQLKNTNKGLTNANERLKKKNTDLTNENTDLKKKNADLGENYIKLQKLCKNKIEELQQHGKVLENQKAEIRKKISLEDVVAETKMSKKAEQGKLQTVMSSFKGGKTNKKKSKRRYTKKRL